MIKLTLHMSKQEGRLLQLALAKQIKKSAAEFREFSREGHQNIATAAREDAEGLESVNIKLWDLIYNRGD